MQKTEHLLNPWAPYPNKSQSWVPTWTDRPIFFRPGPCGIAPRQKVLWKEQAPDLYHLTILFLRQTLPFFHLSTNQRPYPFWNFLLEIQTPETYNFRPIFAHVHQKWSQKQQSQSPMGNRYVHRPFSRWVGICVLPHPQGFHECLRARKYNLKKINIFNVV